MTSTPIALGWPMSGDVVKPIDPHHGGDVRPILARGERPGVLFAEDRSS